MSVRSIQIIEEKLAREPPESRITLRYRKQINNLSSRTNVLPARAQVTRLARAQPSYVLRLVLFNI